MELRLLFSSIRRWWLPIALAAAAFSQLALQFALTANATSTARASLIIQPPASTLGGNINYADPDRYVDTQLAVLKSPQVTARVMEALQFTGTADEITAKVHFVHAPKSDLVRVFATSTTDKDAIDLANAWVSAFISDQDSRLDSARGPELDVIRNRLAEISEQLRAAEDRVYNDPSDSAARVDRDALLVEYTELVRSKTSYEFTNRARVNSSIAEFASQAERSGVRPPLKWMLMGFIVGALLAAASAVGWSWLTPNVVDERQLGDLVGAPVGPRLPWLRPQVPSSEWFLRPASAGYNAAVKEICIRADNAVPLEVSFKIAVVGVKSGLGASSLAVSVASFFSRSARVLLVDGNAEDSDLSVNFDAFDGERISAYELNDAGSADEAAAVLSRLLKRLPGSEIEFIGGLAPRLNRFNVASIMQRFESISDVIVVDCAPFTESALTISVCEVANVVVLLVPSKHVAQETIRQFVSQIGDIPVVAVVSSSRHFAKQSRTKRGGPSIAAVRGPERHVPSVDEDFAAQVARV